jgi:hypothetical protein
VFWQKKIEGAKKLTVSCIDLSVDFRLRGSGSISCVAGELARRITARKRAGYTKKTPTEPLPAERY